MDDNTWNVTIENCYFTNFSNGAGDFYLMDGFQIVRHGGL